MSKILSRELLSYALLALPLAFAGLPIYLLAPDFYSLGYGLSLTSIGISLLFLRFMDAFIDPFLGKIIDRYRSRFRSLMAASAATMGLGIFMLFWVPGLEGRLLLAWFCIAIFISTFAYSFLAIGYGAQGARWSDDHQDQVRITSVRETFTLIGLILAITLPFLLLQFWQTIAAYRAFALILIAALFVSYLVYAKVDPGAGLGMGSESELTPTPDKKQAQPPIKKLYLIYGLSALASAIPAVLVIFFVRDYLGLGNAAGIFLLIYFFAGVISMPLWRRLSNATDKYSAWKLSMLLAIGCFAFVPLLSPGDFLGYAIICLFTGFALGAELALPPAILSELAQKNSHNLGLKYAGLTCLNKVSLALAVGLSLPLLDLIGFTPNAANSPQALTSLLWLYGGLPCALKLLALFIAHFRASDTKRKPTYAQI